MEDLKDKRCVYFTFASTGYGALNVFSKILFVLFVIALIVAVISFIFAFQSDYAINFVSWLTMGYSLSIALVLYLHVIILNVIKTILHTQILHRAVLEDKYDFVEE